MHIIAGKTTGTIKTGFPLKQTIMSPASWKTYRKALQLANFETLFDRRQTQMDKIFQEIRNDPGHKL